MSFGSLYHHFPLSPLLPLHLYPNPPTHSFLLNFFSHPVWNLMRNIQSAFMGPLNYLGILDLWSLVLLSYTLSVISTYKSVPNIHVFLGLGYHTQDDIFFFHPFACIMPLFLMPECSSCNGMACPLSILQVSDMKGLFCSLYLSWINLLLTWLRKCPGGVGEHVLGICPRVI